MLKTTIALIFYVVGAGSAGAQTTDHAQMNHGAHMASGQRQADVAQRGRDVMPFSLAATTHIFTKTTLGGVQQVVVKNANDTEQVRLTRLHLREIRDQFRRGDFSGPTRIHGQDMPGLAELKASKPGHIAITYKDIPAGAELSYTTENAALVSALQRWFDAQLSDHGKDAMSDHAGHDSMKKP